MLSPFKEPMKGTIIKSYSCQRVFVKFRKLDRRNLEDYDFARILKLDLGQEEAQMPKKGVSA
jgi:hypothetical protein